MVVHFLLHSYDVIFIIHLSDRQNAFVVLAVLININKINTPVEMGNLLFLITA
jgi:hypothetical protein